MLRQIDVPAALEARGYPLGISAELHLAVSDPDFEWNHGRFVLRIAGGSATVEPRGTGQVSPHVRDLAALYSGHMTPAELQLGGTLSGPPAQLAALGLAFGGPRPWMADIFIQARTGENSPSDCYECKERARHPLVQRPSPSTRPAREYQR